MLKRSKNLTKTPINENTIEDEKLISHIKTDDRDYYYVPVHIVDYPNGKAIYINGTRITKYKPNGIGTTVCKFLIDISDLNNIINVCREAINDIEKEKNKEE